MDAKYLLAQAKIKEAQKLIHEIEPKSKKDVREKKKRSDKINIARMKAQAVHPFKRIDWRNKIKFYATSIVATSSNKCSDKNVFTDESLQRAAHNSHNTTYPIELYDNAHNGDLIGSARIDGVNKKSNFNTMVAQATIVSKKDIAEKISNGEIVPALTFRILESKMMASGIREIDKIEVLSVSFIPVSDSVDKECKVIDIYKDEDIDKKLEA